MEMKKMIYSLLVICICMSFVAGCGKENEEALTEATSGNQTEAMSNNQTEAPVENGLDDALDLSGISSFISGKTASNAQRIRHGFPSDALNDVYKISDDGGWIGGFWTGLNFLCYEMTGDKTYADTAQSVMERLKERLYRDPVSIGHDIGFLFSLSYVADYKLTGNEESKKVALDAADALARRYNEKAGFVNAWNVWARSDPFSQENRARMIIDTMYNLPLLFWASQESGDERYAKIAEQHAETSIQYLVRDDDSTFHTYVFDPSTGAPKYGRTYQGFSDDSCWARGQAWAIGGFAHAYRYTKNEKFLDIAKKCARFFIENLEEDKVPMWDFRLPTKDGEPRDTSAAAIAAAGLLEISRHVPEEEKAYYESSAKEILISLYNNYSTKDFPDKEGLLLQACANKPANVAINCSLIYGDYYFAECIARLMGKTETYW